MLKNSDTMSRFARETLNLEETSNIYGKNSLHMLKMSCMSSVVVRNVKNVVEIGQNCYNQFVRVRFLEQSKDTTVTISKNKLSFSVHHQPNLQSRKLYYVLRKVIVCCFLECIMPAKPEMATLMISSHTRELRSETKSDLVTRLEFEMDEPPTGVPAADAKFIDVAVMVKMLPGAIDTWSYSQWRDWI